MRSMRYFVPAIRDLAEVRKGRPIAPLDDFRTGRAGLILIGIEGVSMIAVSGARHGRLEAQVQVRPDGLDPSFRRREATRQDGRDRSEDNASLVLRQRTGRGWAQRPRSSIQVHLHLQNRRGLICGYLAVSIA
jgi:hypothetical protein